MSMNRRSFALALFATTLGALMATPAIAQDRDRSMRLVSEFSLTGDDGGVVPNHTVKLPGPIEKLPGVVTAANPDGKITLVEFYDLNCPFCRIASVDIEDMVSTDPNLKLVLVPYPVLGPASVAASQVELALAQLATPQQFYAYHQKVYAQRGTITGLRAFQLAREAGFDGRAIDTISDSDDVAQTIKDHLALGESLGISATPGFIIGGVALLGYPGRHALQAIVNAMSSCGKVTCESTPPHSQ
jgi:protein-disulfide isomerase